MSKPKIKIQRRAANALRRQARENQIRLNTVEQIGAATAIVLQRDYEFTPDQCVEFSGKVLEQINANNQPQKSS